MKNKEFADWLQKLTINIRNIKFKRGTDNEYKFDEIIGIIEDKIKELRGGKAW